MKSYRFSNLTVRSYPTPADVANPWIYGGVQLVINVSERPYSKEIADAFKAKGIEFHHFPLVEEGPDMGLENIRKAVSKLIEGDREGKKMIMHCVGGNNRSRTVAECFALAKIGTQYEDEYKGHVNHLAYNCAEGHLPPLEEMERIFNAPVAREGGEFLTR